MFLGELSTYTKTYCKILLIIGAMKKWLYGIGLVILVGYLALLLAIPRVSPRPNDLGVTNGQLKACPGTPNCISTQSTSNDAYEQREPIAIPADLSAAKAMEMLVALIEKLPRTTIIERTDNYLYVEFRTFAMRYIDDVEFYIDDSQHVIHYRSASRLGTSDLGANGKRMEQIVAKYNEQ